MFSCVAKIQRYAISKWAFMDNKNIDPSFNPERFLETQKYKGSVTALILFIAFYRFFNGGF